MWVGRTYACTRLCAVKFHCTHSRTCMRKILIRPLTRPLFLTPSICVSQRAMRNHHLLNAPALAEYHCMRHDVKRHRFRGVTPHKFCEHARRGTLPLLSQLRSDTASVVRYLIHFCDHARLGTLPLCHRHFPHPNAHHGRAMLFWALRYVTPDLPVLGLPCRWARVLLCAR